MQRLACVVWVAAIAACSDQASPPPALVAHSHCAIVDSLELAPVQIAQTATRIVYFMNAGTTNASHLSPVIAGPDASAFTATADSSEIPVGSVAIVTVTLTGTGTVGDKQATLKFGGMSISLLGHEVAPVDALLVTSANLEFVTAGDGFSQQLEFSNQGMTTLSPQAITAEADGLAVNAYWHDTQTIPAAGQGEVNVDAAVATGCGSGVVHVHTDQTTVDVPIAGEYLPIAQVALSGDGSGTVISDPPAITCGSKGGTCEALTPSASFSLTATPNGTDHFNGWDDSTCGFDPTCIVTTATNSRLSYTATFAPADFLPIQVDIAGSGAGVVTGAPVQSSASYTFYVAGGGLGAVQLVAKAYSQFTGWSGDCSGMDTCSLSVLTSGHNVTATFGPDPHETSSRIMPLTGAIAALAGGDLVVAADLRLVRITSSNTVVWARPLLYRASSLITTSSGVIYFQDSIAIYAVGQDGTLLWSIPADPSLNGEHIATAFGDDLVVGSAYTALEVRAAADGSVKWSAPINGAAFATTSNLLAVAAGNTIHRYDAMGTEALPTWTAPGPAGIASMSFDSSGDLVVLSGAATNGGGIGAPAVLSRFSPAGTVDLSVQTDSSGSTGGGEILALAGGQIATLRAQYSAYDAALDLVEVYDSTGTRIWSVRKGIGWTTGDVYYPFGFRGELLAKPSGGFWVVGSYDSGNEVIQAFAP